MYVAAKTNAENRITIAPHYVSLVVVISIALLFLLGWFYHILLADVYEDSYISFRYAANLVHGNGLVYNPGEYVEGYTNFLWVMVSALVLALHLDPVTIIPLLNFGLALLLVVALLQFGSKMVVWERITTGWQVLALFMLVTCSPVAFALASGLETLPFTMVLTGATFRFVLERKGVSRLPISGFLFGIAALLRPEGAMFWGLTVLYQLISARRFNRQIAWLMGSYLLIWLPYMAWRVSYYGYLLPNTFYAKATSGAAQLLAGLGYVLAAWPYFFGPLSFAAILVVLARQKRLGFIESYFAWLVGVNFIYVASVGGDYMEGYRFLLPTFPMLSLLIAEALAIIYRSFVQQYPLSRSTFALLLIVFAAVNLSGGVISGDIVALAIDGAHNQRSVAEIDWLKLNTHAGDTIAMDRVGKIPYYTGLYTIDMLGLTDLHIAHNGVATPYFVAGHSRTDGEYIMSRKPTYVVIYRNPAGSNVQTYLPGSTAVIRTAEFNNSYVKVASFLIEPGMEDWIYKRNAP